ncbi:MAG: type I restriction enzyme HsdR N-terminal domain-containing protein [Bacteroidota bacterium]
MSLVKKAIKDRYVVINKKTDSLVYLPQGKERRYSNPEEKVQLETYAELIYDFGYPPEHLRVCEKVQIGSSTREADIVVFKDPDAMDPYVIIECKKRKVSNRVFESAVDQGFSYAAVTNAEYVWATSGDKDAAYEVFHDTINERGRNRIDRIPTFKELKKKRGKIRRRLSWLGRNPIVSDTLLYTLVLVICMVSLSKVAVAYHSEIYGFTRPLWENHGMNFNWIYNVLAGASSLIALGFGGVFMRSHQFFHTSSERKRITYLLIAAILFIPAWFIGVNNHDPAWWMWSNFTKWRNKDFTMMIYLWPYLKSIGLQMLLIYGLIWLMNRTK